MNNLPGFSAEKTLYKTKGRYLIGSSSYTSESSIIPALDMSSYRSLGVPGLTTYPGGGGTMQALSARRVPWGSVVIGWTVGGEIGGRIGGDLFGDTGRTYGKWIGAAIGAVFCFFFDCDPGSNGNE